MADNSTQLWVQLWWLNQSCCNISMKIFGGFFGKVLDFIVAPRQILYIHNIPGGWFESTVNSKLFWSFVFFFWCRSSQWCRPWYLEVSVDDLQRVEVGHSLQHLSHHVAGVSLWVVALVQDPVKHLSACRAAETQGNVMRHMLLHISKEKMKNIAKPFFLFPTWGSLLPARRLKSCTANLSFVISDVILMVQDYNI